MKRVVIGAVAVVLALGLTGCQVNEDGSLRGDMTQEVTVTLKDGRTMDCLLYGNGQGSLDCDWANAK